MAQPLIDQSLNEFYAQALSPITNLSAGKLAKAKYDLSHRNMLEQIDQYGISAAKRQEAAEKIRDRRDAVKSKRITATYLELQRRADELDKQIAEAGNLTIPEKNAIVRQVLAQTDGVDADSLAKFTDDSVDLSDMLSKAKAKGTIGNLWGLFGKSPLSAQKIAEIQGQIDSMVDLKAAPRIKSAEKHLSTRNALQRTMTALAQTGLVDYSEIGEMQAKAGLGKPGAGQPGAALTGDAAITDPREAAKLFTAGKVGPEGPEGPSTALGEVERAGQGSGEGGAIGARRVEGILPGVGRGLADIASGLVPPLKMAGVAGSNVASYLGGGDINPLSSGLTTPEEKAQYEAAKASYAAAKVNPVATSFKGMSPYGYGAGLAAASSPQPAPAPTYRYGVGYQSPDQAASSFIGSLAAPQQSYSSRLAPGPNAAEAQQMRAMARAEGRTDAELDAIRDRANAGDQEAAAFTLQYLKRVRGVQ